MRRALWSCSSPTTQLSSVSARGSRPGRLPARPCQTLPDPARPCRTPPAASPCAGNTFPGSAAGTVLCACHRPLRLPPSGATWVLGAREGQPLPPASEAPQGLARASSCPTRPLGPGDATPGPCPHPLRTGAASSWAARWVPGWRWASLALERGRRRTRHSPALPPCAVSSQPRHSARLCEGVPDTMAPGGRA